MSVENWKWFGRAAHFCDAARCIFHLNTSVGRYLISTVGALKIDGKMEKINRDSYYETMVFPTTGEVCPCGCGHPGYEHVVKQEIRTNSDAEATAAHYEMCRKWDKISRRTDGYYSKKTLPTS